MIRKAIDFVLANPLLVLGGALVLFAWGVISFHNLPIEAYPDVADTYAQVITQWPGHAAEEVARELCHRCADQAPAPAGVPAGPESRRA